MHINNYCFNKISDINTLNLSNLNPDKTFLQIFTGFIHKEEIDNIYSLIKQKNKNLQFIGSSTAGEIFNARVQEKSLVISIVEFENTTCEVDYFIEENDYQLGVNIAQSLFHNNTKASILFIDGLKTNGNDVLDGISSINNTVPIAGGMAGDNGEISNTFVFCNKGVYDKGAVAVSLNSDILNVITDYQLNWQPIGQEMTVTKAEKNRLYEINGISASEIYKKYLGDRVGNNLPHSATEFPLLKIEDNQIHICRTFVHQFQDGSLLTIGNLQVGDKVKFAFGNIDLIINNTKENISNYQVFNPEIIFTYSCTSRRAFLQDEINIELAPLNEIAPTNGFFTYGEIFHKNGYNCLLNISLTILGLSEQPVQRISEKNSQKIIEEKNALTNKHFLALDALTNLSNTVIDELEDSKKDIELAHRNINESIEYASFIQQAILPSTDIIKKYFSDSFIFWQPKDKVGGDIYFITELESKKEVLVMIIDGAGHGISGAFVTILVKAIETQIIREISQGKLRPSPSKILEHFNQSIKTMLNPNKKIRSNVGFDGGILYYNKEKKVCKYAGAKTPLYIINNNQIKTLKSDRKHVGFVRTKLDQTYTEYEFSIQENTRLYITTDGFFDQEGMANTRYGKRKFEQLIIDNNQKEFHQQKNIIETDFHKYKNSKQQSDDITVIGLKF